MAIAITLAWVSHGLAGTLSSLFGLLVCGMVMGLAGLAGGMGGGDVKLMAAVGAFLGFPLALFALLYAALLGGLLAVVMAATRSDLRRALGNIWAWSKGVLRFSKDRPALGQGAPLYVPYGVAISAGAIWAVASQYVPALRVP